MKRLLIICGIALLFVPAAMAAAKPATSTVTLSAACGTAGTPLCPLLQPIAFSGSGLDPKKPWEYCYTAVGVTDPCVPVPLQVPVAPDGTVTFNLDGSLFRQAGTYTVYLAEVMGQNRVFKASVAVAVG